VAHSYVSVCLSDIVVCVGLCGCVRHRCSSHCRAQVHCMLTHTLSLIPPSACVTQPRSRSHSFSPLLIAPLRASTARPFLSSPGPTPTLHAELPLLELADSKHRVGAARAYLSDYFAGALVESQVGGGAPPSHAQNSLSHLAPLPSSPLSPLSPPPLSLACPDVVTKHLQIGVFGR